MKDLKLKDLLDIEILQRIQESFYDYTGIPALVTDECGTPLIERAGGNADFCFKLTRKSKEGIRRCMECDRAGVQKARETGEPAVYTCHAGLVDFAVPILLGNRVIGGIVGGQIRSGDVDEERLRQIAAELDLDPEEYIKAAKETYCIPLEQVEKAAKFLSSTAANISDMTYENYCAIEKSRKSEQVAQSHTNFMLNTGMEFSSGMKVWLEEIREISKRFQDDPEISKKFEAILFNGQKLSSVVSGAVDYMHLTGGNVDFSEDVYDVRKVISDNVYSLTETARLKGVELSVQFDDGLLETLVGNSGRIGLILNKILLDCINSATFDRRIEVFTGCQKQLYATALNIKITVHGNNINEALIQKITHYVNNENISADDETVQTLDIPLIYMLIKKMSGTITITKVDDCALELNLTFPQLMAQQERQRRS